MTTVSLVEDIATKVAALPVELQREVLQLIEFLAFKARTGAEAQLAITEVQSEEQKASRQ